MSIRLGTKINEKSTQVFTVSFFDENDLAVIPNTVTWSWADNNGAIINSRSDIVETPATSIDVVLSGNDTVILSSSDSLERVLTVKATYDSSFGSDLPLNEEFIDIEITPIEDIT